MPGTAVLAMSPHLVTRIAQPSWPVSTLGVTAARAVGAVIVLRRSSSGPRLLLKRRRQIGLIFAPVTTASYCQQQRGVQAKRNLGISAIRNLEYAEGYMRLTPQVVGTLG